MTVCSPKYSPVSCKYLPCPGAGAFTVVHVHGTVTDNRPFLLLSIVFKYANPGFTQHGWQKRERDCIVNKRMGGEKKNSTNIYRAAIVSTIVFDLENIPF